LNVPSNSADIKLLPNAAVAVGAVLCLVAASLTSDVPTTATTETSWFSLITRYTSSSALAAAVIFERTLALLGVLADGCIWRDNRDRAPKRVGKPTLAADIMLTGHSYLLSYAVMLAFARSFENDA
jgi:hypothetical protein